MEEKPLIVYSTPDRSRAEELFATLRSRFPGVALQHYLKGSDLLQALQTGIINPIIALIDFEFRDSGPEELPGDLLTKRILKLNPEITVIGYAPELDTQPPDLVPRTIRQAFTDMGAVACVDTSQPVEELLAEMENWLEEEEDEGKWRTGLALATIAAMAALLWLGLLTVPGLVISFYTLPVGGAALFVFAVLYHFDRLPAEISVPAMSGALAMTALGAIVYLAASGALAGVGLGGAVAAGLLAYLILTRR